MKDWEQIIKDKKRLLSVLGVAVLVLALPIALVVSRYQQEIRQRAAGEQTTLYFTQGTNPTPVTSLSTPPGGTVTLELFLDAGSIPLSGFDVTITPDSGLTLSQLTPGPDAAKFNVPLFSTINTTTNSVRYSRVTTDQSAVITGLLHLATITFTASQTPGTGAINTPSVLITSTTSQTGLTVAHAPVAFTIASASTPTTGITLTPTATPTNTPSPTAIPTNTPTPAPGNTVLSLTVCPQGIGNCGDNVNPSGGNVSPVHPSRQVTVTVYDTTNTLIGTPALGTVTYNSTTKNFQGNVTVGNLPTGAYSVWVKMPQFLIKLIPGKQHLTGGQTNILAPVTILAGDINDDGTIDLTDYKILVGCYSDLLPASNCTNQKTVNGVSQADLTDDGVVNVIDYNVFIRNLSVHKGD